MNRQTTAIVVVVSAGFLLSGCDVDPHIERLAGRWKATSSKAVFDLDEHGKGMMYPIGNVPGTLSGPCENVPCNEGTCVVLERFQGARNPKRCELPCSSGSCPAGYACKETASAGYYCEKTGENTMPMGLEVETDAFNAYHLVAERVDSVAEGLCVDCRLNGEVLECQPTDLDNDSVFTGCVFERISVDAGPGKDGG